MVKRRTPVRLEDWEGSDPDLSHVDPMTLNNDEDDTWDTGDELEKLQRGEI